MHKVHAWAKCEHYAITNGRDYGAQFFAKYSSDRPLLEEVKSHEFSADGNLRDSFYALKSKPIRRHLRSAYRLKNQSLFLLQQEHSNNNNML